MANAYYLPSGTPSTGAQGSSSDIRSEFDLIETGLDKLPALTASFVVKVNSGGTALESVQFLAVAQGGTGAATLTDGGILLGSGTGAVTATAVLADGEMLVGDGTTDPSLESGATLRTSIGVGTGDNVTFTNVTGTGVGTFNSLTLTDDLVVAHGGTGVSTLTSGGVLLGSGTGAITAMAVLADGEMIVGDGTTDPVAESGATLRTSIGRDCAPAGGPEGRGPGPARNRSWRGPARRGARWCPPRRDRTHRPRRPRSRARAGAPRRVRRSDATSPCAVSWDARREASRFPDAARRP